VKNHLVAIAAAIAVSFAPSFVQAAPATSTSLDPAAIEASKQLMDVMNFRELTIISLRQAEERLPDQMKTMMTGMVKNDTTIDDGQKTAALAKIDQAMPLLVAQVHALYGDTSLVDEIVAETAPLYARIYTADELRQMAVLYRSPLGKKMLATMPQLMAECAEIGNRLMMPRIQKMMSQLSTNLFRN
jgi:hypothetical protein